ncbi:MAG: hypothetical protein JWP30_100 [Homoserinimonas sp.]|jgi:cell division protein FtsQ|nr:hypothetical protein [Homoserinimonas sp.]
MKRPEGFDPRASEQAAEETQPNRLRAGIGKKRRSPGARDGLSAASPAPRSSSTPRQNARTADTAKLEQQAANRQVRRTARERRKFEREEVRRFTRRSRHRRAAWVSVVGTMLALVVVVAIAVYSPLLALTSIQVKGASRVSADDILNAVDGQLGTPLALVDTDRLTAELRAFPLIQSYVTETVPPNTLVIHITERAPVGSIAMASGFTVVDPAGIVIEKTAERPPGIPMIELAGADTDSDVFDAVVEVLLALPPELLVQVDRVTAQTKDDVTLVLAGVGQRVVWGSVDRSDLKVRVLSKLILQQDPGAVVEYDVTAPLSAVIRPG